MPFLTTSNVLIGDFPLRYDAVNACHHTEITLVWQFPAFDLSFGHSHFDFGRILFQSSFIVSLAKSSERLKLHVEREWKP